MIGNGLIEEVRTLIAMGFTENDIAMKGIGYKEIINCINKGEPVELASDLIKLNTRHYAKRQITWFKRYNSIHWFNAYTDKFDEILLNDMLLYIKESL